MVDTKLSDLPAVASVADDAIFYVVESDLSFHKLTLANLATSVLASTGVQAGAEPNDVDSVFGRTGAVTAAASDYDANQIDFTPAGSIAAANVQAALEELDADVIVKQPLGELAGLNTQTGIAYTLVLTDKGKLVEMNNASANELTVPPNSSVAFPVNSIIHITQLGAGVTSIVAGAGVTIRTPATLNLRAQYTTVTLRKRATDEWVLSGDLATS